MMLEISSRKNAEILSGKYNEQNPADAILAMSVCINPVAGRYLFVYSHKMPANVQLAHRNFKKLLKSLKNHGNIFSRGILIPCSRPVREPETKRR